MLPVIRALAAAGCRVSADTRNAATMAAALDAGARIVNDVSGPDARSAPLPPLVAARGCPVVLMHMRGEPGDDARLAQYDDVAAEVTRELAARAGRRRARPGSRATTSRSTPASASPRTGARTRNCCARLPRAAQPRLPVVVGVSRKGFIGRLSGEAVPRRRLPGRSPAACSRSLGGAAILRVHDVAETVQALRVWRASSAWRQLRNRTLA